MSVARNHIPGKGNRGAETFEACVNATRPGGIISVIGYFGKGDYVKIPRLGWGVGMGNKTIQTALCALAEGNGCSGF